MRLTDDQVIAIVEALVQYECRRDPSDVALLLDGATSLPAVRPLVYRYMQIKADREAAAEVRA